MKREELLRSREYWLSKIQNSLFNMINDYKKEKKLNQTQLAEKLGVTKGYISQILNGDFDHKVSKLVDLALAFNKVPKIEFESLEETIKNDDEYDFETITLTSDNLKLQILEKNENLIGSNAA